MIVLLAIGLPIAVIFAWAFELTPAARAEADDGHAASARPRPVLSYVVLALLAGVLLGLTPFWLLDLDSDERWAREIGEPGIESYADDGDWERAYALMLELERRAPDTPNLDALWQRFASRGTISSSPPGAAVYRRPYNASDDEFRLLGQAPLENVHLPFGLSVLRFELDGHEPLQRTIGTNTENGTRTLLFPTPDFVLDVPGTLPEGMVRVAGFEAEIAGEGATFSDFFLGRHEVTNREFRQFVDAGGYARPECWQHEIVVDGEVVPFDAAVREHFTTQSGLPGPSTWIDNDYAEGERDFPVGGVSWYEAAAYAECNGAELPTAYHWRQAYSPLDLAWLLPTGNYESRGPRAVTASRNLSWPGTYDMTGNVREWVFNAVASERMQLGGGWSDPAYRGLDTVTSNPSADPMDRSAGQPRGLQWLPALSRLRRRQAARRPRRAARGGRALDAAAHQLSGRLWRRRRARRALSLPADAAGRARIRPSCSGPAPQPPCSTRSTTIRCCSTLRSRTDGLSPSR